MLRGRRIAFRLDCTRTIGTGHLGRCQGLAAELRDRGAEILFVMRPVRGEPLFRCADDFQYVELPPKSSPEDPGAPRTWLGVSDEQDVLETRKALAQPCDTIVTDHYAIGRSWESKAREIVPLLFAIDDLRDRSHDCDMLLDQNLTGLSGYQSLVPSHCQTLLGPSYALVRKEITTVAPRMRDFQNPRSIGLYFGGADVNQVTTRVAKALEPLIDRYDFKILCGPLSDQFESLMRWSNSRPRISVLRSVPSFPHFLNELDLMVGAAGSTTWERCYLGLPTIAFAIAANQEAGLQALAERQVLLNGGPSSQFEDASFLAQVTKTIESPEILRSLSEASRKTVDGRGLQRVCEKLCSLLGVTPN